METFLRYAPSPVQELRSELTERQGIRLYIKRDDLLQPTGDERFCGNKVRKLQYNLPAARSAGFERLLTFGGAFSNHIAAVAAAGRFYGFSTIGVIRGEAHAVLNPSLQQAQEDGMLLYYIDRESYRLKNTEAMLAPLRHQFGPFYLIPEGGTNELALRGAAGIISELKEQMEQLPDYICAACGTGGTLAGMIRGSLGQSHLLGIPALKGNFMQQEINRLLGPEAEAQNWSVHNEYHFGGYAKFPPELRRFVDAFREEYGIMPDPVYTAKLFYAVLDLINRGFFAAGTSILMLHSGGLQGWKGFQGL